MSTGGRHRRGVRSRNNGSVATTLVNEESRKNNAARQCKYSDCEHEHSKAACPAYRKICNKCKRKNHFASVCMAKSGAVCQLGDPEEELLALKDEDRKRIYTKLDVANHRVRFLVDCGSTVNLIPLSLLKQIILKRCHVRPSTSTLRMMNDTTHGAAFKKLKSMLSIAPVLRYYEVTKPVIVQCDASQKGMGACILQDGQLVVYTSRALMTTEQSWAQIETKLYAILFAMEKFHSYVYGRRQVTFKTDHKPLFAIVQKVLTTLPKHLQRILLRLQRYDYDPTNQVIIMDTLSRAFLTTRSNGNIEVFTEDLTAVIEEQQTAELRMVASEATVDEIRHTARRTTSISY